MEQALQPTTLALVGLATAATPATTFLAGRSPQTMAGYTKDLAAFARWAGYPSTNAAAAAYLASQAAANAMAYGYRTHMLATGLAPATVNRRLAALRSLARFARVMGWVAWRVEVENCRTQAYRDMAGPGAGGYARLLAAAAGRTDAKGLRDTAVLRLLYDQALRRAEVVGLDVVDFDPAAARLYVRGKGRGGERAPRTLAAPTCAALAAWLAARGTAAGPIFTSLHPAAAGSRLTGTSLARNLKALAATAGVAGVRPHGLRHAAITAALELTGGDIRRVQQFSRHSDPRTLMRYDDARRDMAGEVAVLVAGS